MCCNPYQKEGPKEMWRHLDGKEEGSATVEYAALIAGISVALMIVILAFSSAIRNIFSNVTALF